MCIRDRIRAVQLQEAARPGRAADELEDALDAAELGEDRNPAA